MTDIGVHSELVPQLLRANDWITGILLCGFLLTAYIFSQKRQMMLLGLRNLIFTKERNSIFSEQTTGEVNCKLLLLLQTSLFTAIIAIDYFTRENTFQGVMPSITTLLMLYTSAIILFYILKWCLYLFVNWIFFDESKNSLWLNSYFFIHSIFGVLFFPIILLSIYFNLPTSVSWFFYLFILILLYFLLIYKCFCIFFNKKYGAFYLIMYFCTLEILPILLLWKGVDFINLALT